MSFVPLPEAAKRIAEEPDVLVAEEKLCELLSEHPEAEEVLYQLDGFWGMDWPAVEHLRVQYRLWKEWQAAVKQSEIREKQSEIRETTRGRPSDKESQTRENQGRASFRQEIFEASKKKRLTRFWGPGARVLPECLPSTPLRVSPECFPSLPRPFCARANG